MSVAVGLAPLGHAIESVAGAYGALAVAALNALVGVAVGAFVLGVVALGQRLWRR